MTTYKTKILNERMVARGQGRVREFGMDMYILLYLKWITNKYCIAHGTLLNVMWQLGWEGSWGRMYTWIHGECMYVWLDPFAVHLKLSQHC